MLKSSRLLIMLGAALVSLAVYVWVVTPSVQKPQTIAGFFILVSVTLFIFMYSVASLVTSVKRRRVAWSGVGTLYLVYFIALSTTRFMSFAQFALVSIVLVAGLFFMEKSFTR
jgi:hypothetical protein